MVSLNGKNSCNIKSAFAEKGIHALLFIVVLGFAIYTFISLQLTPEQMSGTLGVGDTLLHLEAFAGDHKDGLLLFALSPGCPYCKLSHPFYKNLVELRDQDRYTLPVDCCRRYE